MDYDVTNIEMTAAAQIVDHVDGEARWIENGASVVVRGGSAWHVTVKDAHGALLEGSMTCGIDALIFLIAGAARTAL